MALLWDDKTDVDAARVEEAADDQPDKADGLAARAKERADDDVNW